MESTANELDWIEFVCQFQALQDYAYKAAKAKGFWTPDPNNGERLALIHSEVSEALEGLREGNPPSEKIPPFTKVEEELADAVIRILDMAGGRGYRLAEAICAKMAYNEGRPYRHGKEF